MAVRTRATSTRERPEPLRPVDRLMEVVALVLLPLGIAALLVGWWGVASNGHVFLQLPYLASGGLLGLALLLAAGFIHLASWISRTAAVQRRQNEELLRAVTQLHAVLAGAGAGANGQRPHYVATPSGTMFHRPDCAIVTGREDCHEVDPDDDAGMQPCGMCAPTDPEATTVLPAVR